MSFKSWSAAQSAASKDKPADKPKAVPATSQPAKVLEKNKPSSSKSGGQAAQISQATKSD